MATDIRILRQYDSTMIQAGREPIPSIRVDFNVGEDGPFSVELPRSEFTAERAREEMENVARETRMLREGSAE